MALQDLFGQVSTKAKALGLSVAMLAAPSFSQAKAPEAFNKTGLTDLPTNVTLFQPTNRAGSAIGVSQDVSKEKPILLIGVLTDFKNAEKMLEYITFKIIPALEERNIKYEFIFEASNQPGLGFFYNIDGSAIDHPTLAPKGAFGPGQALAILKNEKYSANNPIFEKYDHMRISKNLEPSTQSSTFTAKTVVANNDSPSQNFE